MSRSGIQTTLTQKVLLIAFGTILAFFLLEAGLQIASFILYSFQDSENSRALTDKNAYRVMCIGESTTQGQYPVYLEEILNRNSRGIHFSVVDKGVGGTDSRFILAALEDNIRRYRPQMVVAMIGVNDGGIHMPSQVPASSGSMAGVKAFRLYKLFRLLCLHLKCKWGESVQNKMTLVQDRSDWEWYFELGRLLSNFGEKSLSTEAFRKACTPDVRSFSACFSLVLRQGSHSKESLAFIENAGKILTKRLKASPYDHDIRENYFDFGRRRLTFYRAYDDAAQVFKNIIVLDPRRVEAYLLLGKCYELQGKFTLAKTMFNKALRLDGRNVWVLNYLSIYYHEIGKHDLAEKYAQVARESVPLSYLPMTVQNYRRIKDVLERHKIRLLCVQYPLRSVSPLKKIFPEMKDMVFVDNEQVFKKALMSKKYSVLFTDVFAGDFGHCTPLGNRLLAENIAENILNNVPDIQVKSTGSTIKREGTQ
ncbi:MAG: tetratricopeptide repeat protein [Candidatus Omnitrophica bacterium]|nr:tetratricopeptide repeat protein [Candidatus Omnitrophota bacterium]